MRTRRGMRVASDLRAALAHFNPGDIVTAVITGSVDFIGRVTDVNEKICKLSVDWGDGSATQHGPDEIQHAPNFLIETLEKRGQIASRRESLSKEATDLRPFAGTDVLISRRDRIALTEDEAKADPQYVGNPKVHGIDHPRGGGFSIMQNLQKDLAPEALEQAEEGPKIAPQQAGTEDAIEETGNDQNAPDGDQNAPQIASLRNRSASIVESVVTAWNDDGSITESKETTWDDKDAVTASDRSRSARVAPHEGDRIQYRGPDGATTVDEIYDVYNNTVETDDGETFNVRDLRWRGRSWMVRASDRSREALSVPERHQKAIALKTLKMNDVGVKVMGGMTKEEAREFLKKIGYSDSKIRRLEASDKTAAKKEVVKVDWNSEKSIKDAERKKAKLENQGYSLTKTVGGLTTSELVYEMKASDKPLRSRRAMYWTDKDRVYRLTKNEQAEGAICPKCKKQMDKQNFTRLDKLYNCPGCGFKIPSSKTVTKKIEIEIEPDGTVEVEIEPVEASTRRGRYAAVEVPSNLSSMDLSEIAALVSADWTRVNYAAKPYLEAMFSLKSVKDMYGQDSGQSIVAYFLSNASSWRGDVAKVVKKELKKRLK